MNANGKSRLQVRLEEFLQRLGRTVESPRRGQVVASFNASDHNCQRRYESAFLPLHISPCEELLRLWIIRKQALVEAMGEFFLLGGHHFKTLFEQGNVHTKRFPF